MICLKLTLSNLINELLWERPYAHSGFSFDESFSVSAHIFGFSWHFYPFMTSVTDEWAHQKLLTADHRECTEQKQEKEEEETRGRKNIWTQLEWTIEQRDGRWKATLKFEGYSSPLWDGIQSACKLTDLVKKEKNFQVCILSHICQPAMSLPGSVISLPTKNFSRNHVMLTILDVTAHCETPKE